jgi:2-aminoadipate transaminase
MEKLVIAKQGADLHSNYFAQRVIYRYLVDYNLDLHIEKIKVGYKKQREAMIEAMDKYFPSSVEFTRPEGGMFVWATLPEGITALEVFDEASKSNVAFVPGDPFYVGAHNVSTMRINYTNTDEKAIEEGIRRLANAIRKVMDTKVGRKNVFDELIDEKIPEISSLNK